MLRRIRTISFDSAVFDGRGFDARYSTDTGAELRLRCEWDGIEPVAFAGIDTDRYAKLWGLVSFGFLFAKILPVRLQVKAFSLEREEEERWRDWYLGNLGEVFYRSRLPAELDLRFSGERLAPRQSSTRLTESAVLLSGGGKDSVVSAELLKELGVPFQWFALRTERRSATHGIAEVCGELPVTISQFHSEIRSRSGFRKLKPGKLRRFSFAHKKRLRALGWPYLPSTIVEACLLGEASGSRYVLTGNERSSNEGNGIRIGTLEVNHQYGKSYAFERGYSAFLAKYLHPDLRYAGLLMPFYDVQIARIFSSYPQYFAAFRSCNRRRTGRPWCLACSKCAFVFLMMAAFVDEERVRQIFGADLLVDPDMVQTYMDLCGRGGHKPLECVGVAEESRIALYLASRRRGDTPLHPDLLALLPSPGEAEELQRQYLGAYNEENGLPPAWNERFRRLATH